MEKANGTKTKEEQKKEEETLEISIEETKQKPLEIYSSDLEPAMEATK